jgi:ADP-heptose:LPS heptosyltransferase
MSRCVVIFHKQLGDLILLEPALRLLAHGNGHTVDLITRSGFQPIGSLMPFVNIRSKPTAKVYDMLWCLDDRHKSAFYSLLSRAREKHLLVDSGGSVQWYHLTIFPRILTPDPVQLYVSEYYWKHILDGDHGNFRAPELAPPPKEWAYPISSSNYLHVNPTSGWRSKNWTPEKWAITINRLAENGIGPVVMTSGKQDWQRKHCAAICRQLMRPAECITGETTLKNYLWVIWNAKAVLTIDGSASHIAAAFRRKCLTLFGHTNAVRFHRETAYSRALVTGNVTGIQSSRLQLLPHEPVVEATVKLWNSE